MAKRAILHSMYRRTTLIAIFCAALLAGIGSSRVLSLALPMAFWFLIVPLWPLVRKQTLPSLYAVIALGLVIGLARGTIYSEKLHRLQTLSGHSVSITGTATTDAVYSSNQQLEFLLGNIRLQDGGALAGTFRIRGFGTHMVYRGDSVIVAGKLYQSSGSHQANISFAQLSVIGQDHSWVNRLTRRFNTGMENALPEPVASFGLGLLVGQRSNLPQDVLNQLTAVGLIHIVAVSGYNVTILARAVARARLRSRYQKLMLSLGLIWLFILVTGFSASVVRAAIVSGLSLLAWYYGRVFRPIVLIGFTAALTGFINPFYVWGDLSWYLSFLAFFGVLIVAPMLQQRFFKKETKIVSTVLIETLSAELMTLPLILTYFSQLSLVAPLANLLVVPLVPVAMLLSALAAFAGMLLPAIAGWISWPALILLTYMLDISHLLSRLPLAFVKVSAGGGLMAIFYGLVVILGSSVKRSIRRLAVTP